jgi:hypothetical protein
LPGYVLSIGSAALATLDLPGNGPTLHRFAPFYAAYHSGAGNAIYADALQQMPLSSPTPFDGVVQSFVCNYSGLNPKLSCRSIADLVTLNHWHCGLPLNGLTILGAVLASIFRPTENVKTQLLRPVQVDARENARELCRGFAFNCPLREGE